MDELKINQQEIDDRFRKLDREAKEGGYNLNPDIEFTKELIEGILINEKRYGYGACPCRLASGEKDEDLDIICPCDYRDPDLNDYGTCYCGLYVSDEIVSGEKELKKIPERRPSEEDRQHKKPAHKARKEIQLPFQVWRCNVCGYLCARDNPPQTCPVCKATKDRFQVFMK